MSFMRSPSRAQAPRRIERPREAAMPPAERAAPAVRFNLADIALLPPSQAGLELGDAPPPMSSVTAGVAQRRAADPYAAAQRPNRTGLPDRLKDDVESMSALSLDDVRVHYNSPKPAQLQALAYAHGTQIHLGPGQERHLPHEAWHVVQQKQGRVRPTSRIGDLGINDDAALESEADHPGTLRQLSVDSNNSLVIQRKIGFEYELGGAKTYTKGRKNKEKRLKKGTILEKEEGFNVTADDPPTGEPPGSLSDLELVVEPAIDDRRKSGRETMRGILEGMQNYLNNLEEKKEVRVGAYYIRPGPDFRSAGVLQASVGLNLKGLSDVVSGKLSESLISEQRAANAERASLEAYKPGLRERFMNRMHRSNTIETRHRQINRAETHSEMLGSQLDAISTYHQYSTKIYETCVNELNTFELDEQDAHLLASVLKMISTIPIMSRLLHAPPYPKSLANEVMARTDFATIINLLPDNITNQLSKKKLTRVLMEIISKAIAEIAPGQKNAQVRARDRSARVFPHPFPSESGQSESSDDEGQMLDLTLEEWFAGLGKKNRIDRLTEKHYPHGEEGELLEAMGAFHERTDPGRKSEGRRVIVELRTIPGMPVNELVTRALHIWDLVQRANRSGEPADRASGATDRRRALREDAGGSSSQSRRPSRKEKKEKTARLPSKHS